MQIRLNSALTYTLNSLPRGKLHTEPIDNSCRIPWHHVTVDFDSNVFICTCDAWLPIPVGKVDDFDSLESIWNSDLAKVLQQNIQDKKYTWCAVENCGILKSNINQSTYTFSINLDESCNLSCPSCRREMRMLDSGPEYETKLKQLNHMLGWLEKFDKPIKITLTGNGDPLASKIFRPLIRNYLPKPNQKFELKTNGLLLKKQLNDSSIKNFISLYHVSVDAGSKEVYEKVRRPGKWKVLLENFEWLQQNRGRALVSLNFVIQKDNFRDLPNFIELCRTYNFSGSVSPLFDWGTWNRVPMLEPDQYTIENGTFLDHDVADPEHPAHSEFVEIINNHRHKIAFSPYFSKFFNATR